MSGDGVGGPGSRRSRWLGELWVSLALAAFVIQVAAFWMLSANPVPRKSVPGPAREAFVADAGPGAGLLDAWRWLFTPAVFVRPSEEDFSGPAWMKGTAVHIELEGFDVPERPLPWEVERPGAMVAVRSGRPDPALAVRWEPRRDSAGVPAVAGVPLPDSVRVRVVSGLAGRGPRAGWRPESGPVTFVARPVVVRMGVDAAGDLATLPVVWESSGIPEADEAALRVARGMPFAPGGKDAATEWVLVSVEWPVAGVPPGATATRAAREGSP